MVKLDNATAIRFLKQDTYRYLGMLVAVELDMPPFPQEVFGDSKEPSVLMHVQEFPDGYTVASFTGGDNGFVADATDLLYTRYEGARIITHDRRVLSLRQLTDAFELSTIRRTPSLVCTTLDRVLDVTDPQIRKLSRADAEPAGRYPCVRDAGPNLLDMVLEGEQWSDRPSDVYAVVRDNEICAFLAACQEYENVWDVDFISVREDQRGRGLGRQLAAVYARDMLTTGRIPYYSGASNPASEKTALNAGFELCSEVFYADAVRRV